VAIELWGDIFRSELGVRGFSVKNRPQPKRYKQRITSILTQLPQIGCMKEAASESSVSSATTYLNDTTRGFLASDKQLLPTQMFF